MAQPLPEDDYQFLQLNKTGIEAQIRRDSYITYANLVEAFGPVYVRHCTFSNHVIPSSVTVVHICWVEFKSDYGPPANWLCAITTHKNEEFGTLLLKLTSDCPAIFRDGNSRYGSAPEAVPAVPMEMLAPKTKKRIAPALDEGEEPKAKRKTKISTTFPPASITPPVAHLKPSPIPPFLLQNLHKQ